MANAQLPSVIGNLTPEGNLSRYLEQIKRFPMLSAVEEYTLAKDWKDKDNLEAAHKLVTSHLRLVAKIAMGYRGYGLPMGELIAEGNLGMMHAVKRFEPEKGFRLSTYAMWWIRASIQEYILRSWSLVKIGTTAAQKKLFFNLRRIKGEIKAIDDGDMAPEQVTEIAERLDVPEMEVINMNRRLGPGDSVRISGPSSVMWMVCSNCAVRHLSFVVTVQPSSHMSHSWLPRVIIGSIVKTMPASMTVEYSGAS